MADGIAFRPWSEREPVGPARRRAGNKLPTQAKDIILNSMSLMGGADRLAAWALESPQNEVFYWRDIVTKSSTEADRRLDGCRCGAAPEAGRILSRLASRRDRR